MGGAEVSDSFSVEGSTEDATLKIEQAYFDDISETSIFCNLRQAVRAASMRQLSSLRRTNNAHRNNFEFTKSGKVINSSVINFIQKESLIAYVSFIGLVHRFIRLGKLVI